MLCICLHQGKILEARLYPMNNLFALADILMGVGLGRAAVGLPFADAQTEQFEYCENPVLIRSGTEKIPAHSE